MQGYELIYNEGTLNENNAVLIYVRTDIKYRFHLRSLREISTTFAKVPKLVNLVLPLMQFEIISYLYEFV